MLISDLVLEVISEVGGDSDDTELATKLAGFAKSALRRFPVFMQSRLVNAKKSATLTAGALTTTLPAGIGNIDEVFYEDSSTGKRISIDQPGLEEFNRQYNSTLSGPPKYAQIRGNEVEFDRAADQTYTIYFDGSQSIANVTASSSWAYTDEAAEILKDGIKWYYWIWKEDEDKREEAKATFKAGLDQLSAQFLREELPDHVEEAED